MATSDGRMRLAALMHPGGQHLAGWRHPDARADYGIDIAAYRELVQIAERGKFDFAFVADSLSIPDWPLDIVCRSAFQAMMIDPLLMMSNIAASTTNIGFVVTASTTYWAPYLLARAVASLDLTSHGRAGWNIVTSVGDGEAANFGLTEQLPHAERYERAAEFVAVVQGLWSTFGPGAYLGDKASGLLLDEKQLTRFDHDGRFFSVHGCLNVPPSPQGRPVLVQAGASGPGRDLAASVAEVIFAATPDLETALGYTNDIRARLVAAGRSEDGTLVIPGFVPIIGRTAAEARARRAELDELLDPVVGVRLLSHVIGTDLTAYDLDEPYPASVSEGTNRSRWMADRVAGLAQAEGLATLREVAARFAAGLTHVIVAGTAADIADTMEEWFVRGACDGFLVDPLASPIHMVRFVDEVVPELQRRGLYRTEYEHTTLRGNLGLAA